MRARRRLTGRIGRVLGGRLVGACVGPLDGLTEGELVGLLVGPFAASRNTGDSIQLYSVELFVPRIVSFTTPISAWNRSDFEALCVFFCRFMVGDGHSSLVESRNETKI